MSNQSLVVSVATLAQQAGAKILEFYQHHNVVQTKPDSSPLTAADLAANKIIIEGLQQLTPNLPVLSEESAVIPFQKRQQWSSYWLVDPLDGTRDFLEKNGEFTVNIALIEENQPILGAVYLPALATLYFATKKQGAYRQVDNQQPQPIHVQSCSNDKVRVAVSRHHGFDALEKFLHNLNNYTVVRQGSALKFCVVAQGEADVYPRLSPTSEWDTAAGQCILEAAGGAVLDLQGQPLRYNTKESLLNPSFLAVGDINIDWLKLV